MPLKHGYTTRNGERVGFYQWGDSGKRYHYEPGNPHSRRAAKGKAKKQGQAIESGKRG